MADLLTLVRRGPRCMETAQVTGPDGSLAATLICNLKPGHPGPLHYDDVDCIWWATNG